MSFPYTPPPHDKLNFLYIDEDLIIVDKPSGLLSVPGKGEDKQDCLINRIIMNYSNALIVHRLDMDTSGLMVLARNKDSHRMLSNLFQQRQVKKSYTAIVDGIVEDNEGEITSSLITDWPNRPKQKIDPVNGKPSTTLYRVIETNKNDHCSRVKLTPVTGRTHQLRVHMLSIGHAILGDNLYANESPRNKSSRLLLHSNFIEFIHPISKQLISYECEPPF